MSGTTNRALIPLQRRFAIWRRKRSRGMHIPAELWQAAAQVARKYGVWQTSQELHLDYNALSTRLRGSPPAPVGTSFVEIPGKILSAPTGNVVELVDPDGLRLRVELRDAESAQSLARSLWRERR